MLVNLLMFKVIILNNKKKLNLSSLHYSVVMLVISTETLAQSLSYLKFVSDLRFTNGSYNYW